MVVEEQGMGRDMVWGVRWVWGGRSDRGSARWVWEGDWLGMEMGWRRKQVGEGEG